MPLRLNPLDAAGSDRDALVAFLTGDRFPFHVRAEPTVAQVNEAIDAGMWGDAEKETLWIEDDERRRIGLVRLDDVTDATAMVDLRLAAPWRGRGRGAQALALATDRVFTAHPDVIRFEGQTREDNTAMRRTFDRCGWVLEAYYRDGWPVEGGDPVASVAYSVLRRDWDSGRTTPVPLERATTTSEPRGAEVSLTGELRCADAEELERVRTHLPLHVALTRAERGCLSFDVDPTGDPLVWRVEERFVDEAAFDAHQHRVAASAWGSETAGIERRYEIHGRAGDATAITEAAWAAEEQLLDPRVRHDPARVALALADDFVEIGQSGRRFTREAAIAALQADPGSSTGRIEERSSRVIGPGTVLLDYLLTFEGRVSRRSSVWQGTPPRLAFHQGTPVPPEITP